MRRRIHVCCLAVVPTMWVVAMSSANAARAGTKVGTNDCLSWASIACPSDFHTTPITGPASYGYSDGSSGLFLRIDGAFTGAVTLDGGCSSPYRQYQLYLHVMIRNPQRHSITFDLVGLTVKETSGGTYNPFGWGGPYPSHATALGPGKSKKAWIPYYILKPQSFSVRWQFIYPGHATSPTLVAPFQAKPTSVKACSR